MSYSLESSEATLELSSQSFHTTPTKSPFVSVVAHTWNIVMTFTNSIITCDFLFQKIMKGGSYDTICLAKLANHLCDS